MSANFPELKTFNNEEECKKYYIEKYCTNGITTFDNIKVEFYLDKFSDAFYESKNHEKRDKSIFSFKRAERIDWIEYVLQDENAELYCGWDRDKKAERKDRRVAIISPENYVVIITLLNNEKAKFITAYLADSPRTASNIRKGTKWTKNNGH